jgi:hypothetical protein
VSGWTTSRTKASSQPRAALSKRIVTNISGLLGGTADAEKYRAIKVDATYAWRWEFVRDGGTLTNPTPANYTGGLAFGRFPTAAKQRCRPPRARASIPGGSRVE